MHVSQVVAALNESGSRISSTMRSSSESVATSQVPLRFAMST